LKILTDISLSPYTTFGIGGAARWFAEAQTEEDVVEAVAWARERHIKLFVLGGGSNLLVADTGFDGLVLHVTLKGITCDGERLCCAAGEAWDDCVEQAAKANLAGVECLAGIPGTVGGTPVQNVGAYGQEVSSTIERVRAFDLKENAFVELKNGECGFAYRRSRFNSVDRGRFIVTRVDYSLRQGGGAQLNYADLKACFKDCLQPLSLTQVTTAVREIRKGKGMLLAVDDPDCRSAGSFFKNPAVGLETAEKAQEYARQKGLALRVYPTAEGLVKIPAAWLIEQAGFGKGFALGRAGISNKHTLALVNRGGATAEEIVALAERIGGAVEERFGIWLEMEPVRVGF
jgi:UDP-N-acetylmuramate dehydrogenase